MTTIHNIRTLFPDNFNINYNLKNNKIHNPEFFTLTLKAYKIQEHLKNQKLSIAKSLKTNKIIDIYDHQILAAQKVKNIFGGTAILADEVGLGKTIEAGIIIKEFIVTGLAKKILILTPPSLTSQWKRELSSKFDLDFVNYKGNSYSDILSHDLLIMSHSSAVYPNKAVAINAVYWDLVIVDEAHSMKNSTTFKHLLVKNLPKRNLLLLTATPLQNNLKELYNLIDLLRPGYLGTWNMFEEKYIEDKQCRKINPYARNELQQILSKIIIRTTRNEIKKYIKFTDRIPYTKILNPTDNESKLYDEITSILQNQYNSVTPMFVLMHYQRLATSSTSALKKALYRMKQNKIITYEKYTNLMSIANNIQMDTKLSYLLDILKNTSKFLIFTEFLSTQNYIAENLLKNGYSITLFNGSMNNVEKQKSVQQFKNDKQVMISTSAGGEGQNFQFCHNIVNYDLPWNPMRIEQRIGRVHRIGQKNNVNIFNLAIDGTIESYILELLYTKINLFKMSFGEMDLLFEDSIDKTTESILFNAYLSAQNEKERRNKFSAIGDNWKQSKKNTDSIIKDFNPSIFKNFDLSAIGNNENES